MDRTMFGIALCGFSLLTVWRAWMTWTEYDPADGRGDRVRARAAPAVMVCCGLTAVLGVLVVLYSRTGTGLPAIHAALVAIVLSVLGALAAVIVIARQESVPGDLRPSRGGALPSPPRPRRVVPTRSPELAHGLAVGAWHVALTGRAWDDLDVGPGDRAAARDALEQGWGVRSTRDWQRALTRLADPAPSGGDVVFGLRRDLGGGDPVPHDEVARAIERALVLRGREATDALLAELRRVEAYEHLLRERGLLAPSAQVASLLGWDHGRGAHVVRLGRWAGFCDVNTTERQLERFGALARRYFASWPEFGASLVLGRLLWSDTVYDAHHHEMALDVEDSLRPFAAMLEDPASPWRTVPFRLAASA